MQIKKAKEENTKLADQKSPQISVDADFGNEEENTGNSDYETDGINEKGKICLANSIQNAEQRIVRV